MVEVRHTVGNGLIDLRCIFDHYKDFFFFLIAFIIQGEWFCRVENVSPFKVSFIFINQNGFIVLFFEIQVVAPFSPLCLLIVKCAKNC